MLQLKKIRGRKLRYAVVAWVGVEIMKRGNIVKAIDQRPLMQIAQAQAVAQLHLQRSLAVAQPEVDTRIEATVFGIRTIMGFFIDVEGAIGSSGRNS